MTGKTVLVLGGTGHIGSAIARHFDGEGYRVIASGRNSAVRPNLVGTSVTQVAGDDTRLADLERWSEGADLIIDAATPYPVWLHEVPARTVVSQAQERIRIVLDTARRRSAALVHISSFTTLPLAGGIQDRLRLSTIRGLHPYFEVKDAVEKDVRRALRDGLKGCVINPSACFGPYDLKPRDQAFVPLLLNGKVTGSLRHVMNVVDVRDVAACVGKANRQGFPFPQVSVFGHNIRVDALVDRICALGGVAPPRLKAPLLLSMAAAYWAETAAAVAGRKSPWPSLPILLTAAGRETPQSPQQQKLGLAIRPLEQTLADAITWYRQIGRC